MPYVIPLSPASQLTWEQVVRVRCISQSQSSKNINKESKDMVKGICVGEEPELH